jgi:hypothetical protein
MAEVEPVRLVISLTHAVIRSWSSRGAEIAG